MRGAMGAGIVLAMVWAASAGAAELSKSTFAAGGAAGAQTGTIPLFEGEETEGAEHKSPRVAFLMSLAVPGLGEIYTGATKRAIAFMAVEALTWINYARWRSKGNDLKADFRRFADQYWDEVRYREWQEYNRSQGSPFKENETLPCKESDPGAGGCVKVDTQQYYEMIGKYDQFVFGWDDTRDEDFSTFNPNVRSPNREDYEDQRTESNKFLKRASIIIGLAVLNRVVSAFDASVHARSLSEGGSSRRFEVAFGAMDGVGRPAPSVTVKTRF